MNIAVVIVNYRTAQLTVDCLRSIALDGWLPAQGHGIVVDNASADESMAIIEQEVANNCWNEWVELVPASRNGGFAYGNNVGIRRAMESTGKPRYFLLLNPDTIVQPGAIEALVRFMEGHPNAGIVGSRLEDPDGTSQQAARRFPTILSELESAIRLNIITRLLARWIVTPPEQDRSHECDWLPGASLMVRREVLEQVGALDEGYFMYYEEVDFCLRAKRAGWQVWYEPTSRVTHLVGQSSGVTARNNSSTVPNRRPVYWFESRRRYFAENHGSAYRVLADLAWTSGTCLNELRRFIQRRPRVDPPYLLRDFIRRSLRLNLRTK
jgi:GT2 family glycosyltransferase